MSAARRARAKRLRESIAAGQYQPTPRRSTTAEIRDVVTAELRDMRAQIEAQRSRGGSVPLQPKRSASAAVWVSNLGDLLGV